VCASLILEEIVDGHFEARRQQGGKAAQNIEIQSSQVGRSFGPAAGTQDAEAQKVIFGAAWIGVGK